MFKKKYTSQSIESIRFECCPKYFSCNKRPINRIRGHTNIKKTDITIEKSSHSQIFIRILITLNRIFSKKKIGTSSNYLCCCRWTTEFLWTLSTAHLLLQSAFILLPVGFRLPVSIVGKVFSLSLFSFQFILCPHLFTVRGKKIRPSPVAAYTGLQRIGDQLVNKDLHLRLFVLTGIDMLFFFQSIWNCVCLWILFFFPSSS